MKTIYVKSFLKRVAFQPSPPDYFLYANSSRMGLYEFKPGNTYKIKEGTLGTFKVFKMNASPFLNTVPESKGDVILPTTHDGTISVVTLEVKIPDGVAIEAISKNAYFVKEFLLTDVLFL